MTEIARRPRIIKVPATVSSEALREAVRMLYRHSDNLQDGRDERDRLIASDRRDTMRQQGMEIDTLASAIGSAIEE